MAAVQNDPFGPYRGRLNKYAYMPLVNIPLTDYPNNTTAPILAPILGAYNNRLNIKLCDIAGMEGWHDHHGITSFGQPEITASVRAYVPNGCNGNKPESNEPAFLNSVVSSNANAPDWKTFPTDFNQPEWYGNNNDPTSSYATWKAKFSPNITEKYVIALVKFPTKDVPMVPSYSCVQKCFNMNQINDNVYILRDVAYGGWGRDIRKWGQNTDASEQYIYNVQTSSGIYDPGPSLSYFSDAGIKCGYQAMESKSRYGLFDCYYPAETILDYPAYPILDYALTSAEQLMYTKYNCKLFGDNSIPNIPDIAGNTFPNKDAEIMVDSAAVNLIVEVPGTTPDPMDKQLYIVTKHTSNKASSIFDLPFISSCIKYSAAVDAIDIASATYNFNMYDIIERSGPLKIMTKKFGDSGIAIQTLRSNLHFYAFNPAANNRVTISKQQSNGIHAFLTYDQVATGAALEYGAPIVIYNTKSTAGLLGSTEHDYAIIFISKTMQTALSNPTVRLRRAIESAQNLQDYGGVNLQELQETQTARQTATQAAFTLATDTLTAALDAQAAQVVKLMRKVGYENLSTKHDIDYRIFLTKWYKLATLIKIYTDNNASFDTLNEPSNINNIIQRYSQAVAIKANTIQLAATQLAATQLAATQLAALEQATTDLDNISNSYREYINMMNSYTSIATTFRDLNTSIATIDKIKIGDTSKIIDNCDPYNGTFKVYRIRKILSSFQGQSEALIELGTVVIIQIYENLKKSTVQGFTVQTVFKDQIRNIFNNIKTTCALNLIPKLELAFNFIPNEQDVITQPPANFTGYRDLFVPTNQVAGRVESNLLQQTLLDTPAMDGPQATYPTLMLDNKNSTPNVLAAGPKAPNEELLNKPSIIVNSPVTDNHMFTDVLTQLDQLINLIVASSTDMVTNKRSENVGQILQNMKPLLEATKKVIETQGPIYTDTLNSQLSYKHLQADALIHQPLFVFSFLQTILQYYGSKTVNNTNDLTGGAPISKRQHKQKKYKTQRQTQQQAIEANRVDDLNEQLFLSSPIRRTRLSTAPFNVANMTLAITQYYNDKQQTPPEPLPNVTTVSLEDSDGKVNVYGYILPIRDLLIIIKNLSIIHRSNEVSFVNVFALSRDAETGSVIEDVTTSWSIAQTIFAGAMSKVNLYNPNTLDTDNNNDPIFITQVQQNPDELFFAFIEYIDEIRIIDENWMILHPDFQQNAVDVETNVITPINTKLHNISQDLNKFLNNTNVQLLDDNLDDYEYALRAVFPVTYYPPLDLPKRKGGNMNKKTIRQPKKPKTNKRSKTRRKYAKTKQHRTKKRTKKSKVRGPIKTRP